MSILFLVPSIILELFFVFQELSAAVSSHESDLHDVALVELLLLDTDAVTLSTYLEGSSLPEPTFMLRSGASDVIKIGQTISQSYHSLIKNIDAIQLVILKKVQVASDFEAHCEKMSSKLQSYDKNLKECLSLPVSNKQVVERQNELKVDLFFAIILIASFYCSKYLMMPWT